MNILIQQIFAINLPQCGNPIVFDQWNTESRDEDQPEYDPDNNPDKDDRVAI
jgi:hypothetical protein